jgi:hypothetical protein
MTTAGPCAFVLRVLDVGAAIDLDAAAARLEPRRVSRGASRLRGPLGAGAGGVVLASSPVDIDAGEVEVGGLTMLARVRLFEFGVASVRFATSLDRMASEALVPFAARVEDDDGFDEAARAIWARLVADLGPAVAQPGEILLIEDYSVFVLDRAPGEGHQAEDVMARLLLGEDSPRPLSRAHLDDARARAIRYFEDDLVMIDYDAAVVVDPLCSHELVDIFELATAYLVELRYYDSLLSRASASLVKDAERQRHGRWMLRSPFHDLAERAVMLVLELNELTDSFERSIVLLGDTYSVQVYQAAAARFRIPDLTTSVHEKLGALGRSAEILSEHVQSRRGVALEILVIVLIAFEVAMALFKH